MTRIFLEAMFEGDEVGVMIPYLPPRTQSIGEIIHNSFYAVG
jgi:hypothetical protein